MTTDLVWRVLLLGMVFAIDLAVFVDLCQDELEDWRASKQPRDRLANDEAYSTLPLRGR